MCKPITEQGITLDLHYDGGDEDFEIPPSGEYLKSMKEIESRIAAVKDTVRAITLEGQDSCTEVPRILRECPNLEELNLLYTGVKEIPDFVFSIPGLVSLKYNWLDKQPENLAAARNLQTLAIGVEKSQELPPEVFSLTKLVSLHISGSGGGKDDRGITELPAALGNLTCLEELELSETRVSALPPEAGNLRRLKRLEMGCFLWKDHLLDLDALVEILSANGANGADCPLEHLRLRSFRLGGRYAKLTSLARLKHLDLACIRPEGEENIIEKICALASLEELSVYGSSFGLKQLPPEIGNLRNLKTLSITGNFFQNIPPSVWTLEHLETLEFRGCGIGELSGEVHKLRALQTLDLGDNLLETLPETLFSLENLRSLDISDNNFSPEYLTETALSGKRTPSGLPEVIVHSEWQGYRLALKRFKALSTQTADYSEDEYFASCMAALKEFPSETLDILDPARITPAQYAEAALAAVQKNGYALELVDHTRLDTETYYAVCAAAFTQDGRFATAIKYAALDRFSPAQYKALCLGIAEHSSHWKIYEHIDPERFASREDYLEVCRVSLTNHPLTVSHMKDPPAEFWLEALERGRGGSVHILLRAMPEELKTPENCRSAVEKDGIALKYVPEHIKTAPGIGLELCRIVLGKSASNLEYVPPSLLSEELCFEAMTKREGDFGFRGYALEYVPEELRSERVCIAALQDDSRALDWIPEALQAQVKQAVDRWREAHPPLSPDDDSWVDDIPF